MIMINVERNSFPIPNLKSNLSVEIPDFFRPCDKGIIWPLEGVLSTGRLLQTLKANDVWFNIKQEDVEEMKSLVRYNGTEEAFFKIAS